MARPQKHHGRWRIRWVDPVDGTRRSRSFESYSVAERALHRVRSQSDEIRVGLRLALLREWAEADAVEPAEDGDADVNLDEETCEDNDHETDDEAPSDAPDSDVEPDDDNDQFPRVGAR
jgi:hypothetical protein